MPQTEFRSLIFQGGFFHELELHSAWVIAMDGHGDVLGTSLGTSIALESRLDASLAKAALLYEN